MAMDMAGTYPSSCIVSAQTLLSGKDPQLTPARGSLHKLYKKHGLGIHTYYVYIHGLRTPRVEIAFTARPKIQSQSQIFRYCRSIFCLPHWPNFSDIFDLCVHWVSVVRVLTYVLFSKSYRIESLILVI